MSVRAKFKCHSNNNGIVTLHPVYAGSDENKTFWEATPAGTIALTITNQQAKEQFIVGQEYYVDFTPAE